MSNNTLDLGVPRPKLDAENKRIRATFSLPKSTIESLELLSDLSGGISMSKLVERAVEWLVYDMTSERQPRLARDPQYDQDGRALPEQVKPFNREEVEQWLKDHPPRITLPPVPKSRTQKDPSQMFKGEPEADPE